ncbi:putative defensin, plant, knottin, scorpion toxin-like superfamily [Helianthus annuus]|nr:putative defensin, plant, knottin, scorpion toxin-like superfamily [Helianthus annuus]
MKPSFYVHAKVGHFFVNEFFRLKLPSTNQRCYILMDRSLYCFLTCFFLLAMLIISEISSSTGEKTKSCKYLSRTYKGLCFFKRNCDIICKAEGAMSGGRCQAFTLRCLCNGCDPD